MATLLVRNLDEDLVRRLKERAKARGQSTEAEHRAILEEALRPPRDGRELWRRLSRVAPLDIDFDEGLDQTMPETRLG
jgi:plasmid stability protein